MTKIDIVVSSIYLLIRKLFHPSVTHFITVLLLLMCVNFAHLAFPPKIVI